MDLYDMEKIIHAWKHQGYRQGVNNNFLFKLVDQCGGLILFVLANGLMVMTCVDALYIYTKEK